MRQMPEDVKQICLWLARGYRRRVEEYRMTVRVSDVELKRIEAVERALVAIGKDIDAEEVRQQLRDAIMLNVESGRRYPYEKLDFSAVSRSDFYRRRDKFLEDIAVRMDLLPE